MVDTQTVIFDLYGTLIYLAKETEPYSKLFTDIGLRTSKEFRQAYNITLTEDFNNLESFVERIKPNTRINLRPYQQELEKEVSSATLYPETKNVLKKLQERNFKLGLISNLASPYKRPFFKLGLNKYFNEILFSCEVGLKKPNPKIYQKMIEKLNINFSQVLMIGDDIPADVDGPKLIGVNAIHLNRTNISSSSIFTLEEIFQHL